MFEQAFRWELAHGLCIGVALPRTHAKPPDDVAARLHPAEREYAATLSKALRDAFIGGRLALREALSELGAPDGPILRGETGEPLLPSRFTGSISHKSHLAVAVADLDTGWRLGADLEMFKRNAEKIARRVLTETELRQVDHVPTAAGRSLETLIRFSMKESVYKAVNSHVGQNLKFKDLSLTLRGSVAVGEDTSGFAHVRIHAPWDDKLRAVEAHYLIRGEWILTTAKAKFFCDE